MSGGEFEGFPQAHPPGKPPKIDSIFDFSDKALNELLLYLSDKVQVPIGQVLGFPVQSRFLDRSPTTIDIANTAAETELYSATIAAGQMGIDRLLRLTMVGDFLHNNAIGDVLTFRVKLGGTTFMGFNFGGNFGNVTGASRQVWKAIVEIANLGATNSQMMSAEGHCLRANAGAPTAGAGGIYDSINTGGAVGLAGTTTLGTIDTTIAQTLSVTGQWSAGSVNNSFRRRHAILELV